MARWERIEAEEPEFAARAREHFDAGVHKTIATLRADGSPRISGIEASFLAGDLWFGSMPGARKAADLIRDPRFALHSASEDPPGWSGDAKLSGRAIEIGEGNERDRYLAARAGDSEPDPPGELRPVQGGDLRAGDRRAERRAHPARDRVLGRGQGPADPRPRVAAGLG